MPFWGESKNTGVGCYDLLPGDLPNPGMEPRFPALQADSLLSEPPGRPPKSSRSCQKPPAEMKNDEKVKLKIDEKNTLYFSFFGTQHNRTIQFCF